MDKSVGFLESLPPESLKLTLNQQPFFQRQHRDYWSIDGLKFGDYDLFVCTGGQAEFSQRGETIILTEGKALLAEPGTPLFAKHLGDDFFTTLAQHFDFKVFGELNYFSLVNYSKTVQFQNWEYIKTILSRYQELVSSHRKKLEQYSLFHTIITEFIYESFLSEKSIHHESYNFIFLMLSYIQDHFTEENVLEKALLLSSYSHDYTSRVFRKRIGVPPKQYILKSRLELGQKLLLQDIAIKEIAYLCGFTDELYFSRLFKKYLNISPREFRTQHYAAESGSYRNA